MKLSQPIEKSGIFEEVNRVCGATANSYPNYDKVARVNAALDRYLELSKNRLWALDDHDNITAPIETQNLVSGTNIYQFASFSSEVYELIRLEILDSSGNGHALIPETMDNLSMQIIGNASGQITGAIGDSFEELYTQAGAGLPTHYVKIGDFVYLRDNPNYAYTAGLIAYFSRPLVKYTFVTFTTTFATDTFDAVAHGLTTNDAVIFETDSDDAPSGITVDTTVYYVIASGLTADAFKVSTTIGGSTITLADDGTGNHKFLKVSKEPGIISMHHPYLARHASLPFLIEKKLPQINGVAQQIALDENEIMEYYNRRNNDITPRLEAEPQNNR